MKYYIITFLLLCLQIGICQESYSLKGTLIWNSSKQNTSDSKNPSFLGAQYCDDRTSIPILSKQIKLASNGQLKVELIPTKIEVVDLPNKLIKVSDEFKLKHGIYFENRQAKAWVEIETFRKNNGRIERLVDYEIKVVLSNSIQYSPPPPPFKLKSVLADGELYKISITETGIYKIDKNFLEKNLNLNLSTLDPRKISIYGNGSGMLPESNAANRIDDLEELSIWISGENDGVFNATDQIFFYAKGPDRLEYNSSKQDFDYAKNIYSTKAYYFIKINSTNGKRIGQLPSIPGTFPISNTNFTSKRHEKDLLNILDFNSCNHGTGQSWVGESVSPTRVFDFADEFTFPGIIPDSKIYVSGAFVARSSSSSNLVVKCNSAQETRILHGVSLDDCTATIAADIYFALEAKATTDKINVSVEPKVNGSISYEGWLDFIQLSATTASNYTNKPLHLFDPSASKNAQTSFRIGSAESKLTLWKINDFHNAKAINFAYSNNTIQFNDNTLDQYNSYILFNDQGNFSAPEFVSKVENQNLHSITDADLIIVYHPKFKSEALRLKKHREDFSKFKVEAVDITKVYNEFSSGADDPTGLRDFSRMVYTRSPNYKYLLLFGDGSYDFRHIDQRVDNESFVPTYETLESYNPINGFPTDDYYALLDDTEGADLVGLMDVSVGRLLCRNEEEAKNQVDKIIQYDLAPESLGDWRLNMIFASDDEDGNVHLSQIESIADETSTKIPNLQKIYFDAFDQVTTPGGERYPGATKAINASVFQGALTLSYMGHGGPTGLAQERVLLDDDIRRWDNAYRLPLMVTATCSFNAFDDPSITNAGEYAVHNKSGAIALFSTVRAVYSDDNYHLTRAVHNKLYEKIGKRYQTIGEILTSAKNENSSGGIKLNSRKFMLFGDPSLTLAYPDYSHAITSINNKPLSSVQDTFKALERMTIKGYVKDELGNKLSSFNGELSATIFDKEITLKTKGNDPSSSPFTYNIQKNIIFKGSSAVTNGEWEFSFIIPKDINYEYGQGKISLYASNLKDADAASYSDGFIIGGVSKDSIKDDSPPIVKLFINDDAFVNGGITNESPKLFAKLSDDLGINISGNSIGHDVTAVLDGDGQNPIILNNYFKSKLNDSRQGEILFPLNKLNVGKHTLSLTAWDISNKMGQADIEFYILDDDQIELKQVLNYPNPFFTSTEFQFETNLTNAEMTASIYISTLSGKLVKTIQKTLRSNGNRITGITWDGTDDFGSALANGVYIYQIKLNAEIAGQKIKKSSDYQKLVKLK